MLTKNSKYASFSNFGGVLFVLKNILLPHPFVTFLLQSWIKIDQFHVRAQTQHVFNLAYQCSHKTAQSILL